MILLTIVSLLGLLAFVYPFWLSVPPPGGALNARATDAPLLIGILVPVLLLVVLAEWSAQQSSAKQIALLGVLTATNTVLRLPVGLGDAPTFFFLPILLGYAWGGQWGFLVGAFSVFVSDFVVGAVGPPLPFRMWAVGWLGLGAVLVRPAARLGQWWELVPLAVYSYVGALLFGALMNLYFWPVVVDGTALSWEPGLGLGATLQRYWLFYLTTSLAWDTLRAVSTTLCVVVLGRPVLAVLRRFQARWQWVEAPIDSPHKSA